MSEWALPGKQPGGNHAPEPCYHRPRADGEVIEGVQQTGQASAGEDDPGGGGTEGRGDQRSWVLGARHRPGSAPSRARDTRAAAQRGVAG